jgi:hypothetical protein
MILHPHESNVKRYFTYNTDYTDTPHYTQYAYKYIAF